jgi:hypothetical protein
MAGQLQGAGELSNCLNNLYMLTVPAATAVQACMGLEHNEGAAVYHSTLHPAACTSLSQVWPHTHAYALLHCEAATTLQVIPKIRLTILPPVTDACCTNPGQSTTVNATELQQAVPAAPRLLVICCVPVKCSLTCSEPVE